jgi:hypothetical protein
MPFIKNSTAVLAQFIIAHGCSATVVSRAERNLSRKEKQNEDRGERHYLFTSGFRPRVRARALPAPVFLGL